eukprot:669797-Amphidinium_carterae.1
MRPSREVRRREGWQRKRGRQRVNSGLGATKSGETPIWVEPRYDAQFGFWLVSDQSRKRDVAQGK